MNQYVVYRDPSDYPGQWVVRRWTVFRGKLIAYEHPEYVGPCLAAARESIPRNMLVLQRHPDDDPSIFEVWI